MKQFSVLIKPASSTCNMTCKYCFYYDVADHRVISNYGIMSDIVMNKLIDRVFAQHREPSIIHFMFQGGEPTLAGIDYFKKFIAVVNDKKTTDHIIKYSIQTNGTLLNKEFIELFKKYNFLVGVSLDGFKSNHDKNRLINKQLESYDLVISNISLLQESGVEFNVLTVLTPDLAKKPKEYFKWIKEYNFRYIQLIPCLGNLDNQEDFFALKPHDFYEFYNVFFDLWYEDYLSGNYISISFFDNVVNLFGGVMPAQCGFVGNCHLQYVVESDGGVYPCDFYVLDQYKMGDVIANSFKELAQSKTAQEFLTENKNNQNDLCPNCRYLKICNGQCKRLSSCYYNKDYCGYQEFLKKKEAKIINIIKSGR
ncbi:MAG: radical SAM protein [Erysipelotrichaceae bacterium]